MIGKMKVKLTIGRSHSDSYNGRKFCDLNNILIVMSSVVIQSTFVLDSLWLESDLVWIGVL
jgi:hypothetical protein